MSRNSKKKKKRVGTVIALAVAIVLLVGIAGLLLIQGGFIPDLINRNTETASNSDGSDFDMHYVSSLSEGNGGRASASSAGTDQSEAAAADSSQKDSTETDTDDSGQTVAQISGDGVYSSNALMIRNSDNAVIFDKNSDQKVYPASMTKVMTAIIALESFDNLDDTITIQQSYIDKYYKEGASRAGFEAGETVTLRDVLYGVLLPSGAECCLAVCDRVAGSEDAFVEKMNEKAAELGMTYTHFVNSIGMHDDNHYTTCADFIKLMKYAIQNDTFREITSTRQYTTSKTDIHPDGITLTNTLFRNLSSADLPNGAKIIGGKTGYTSEALCTLASYAEYNGDTYIMVTAHGGGISHANLVDAVTLYGRLGSGQ